MMLSGSKSRKIGIVIGLTFVVSFGVVLFWSEFKMRDYKITCANFVSAHRTKSNWYYDLEYQIGDKLYKSSRQGKNYNGKVIDYLDTIKCIKIAYSESDPTCVRILDQKVADEWLWFFKEVDK